MSVVYSACPLDCPDVCSFAVTVKEGVITQVTGNPLHPHTKGGICSKGQGLLRREQAAARIKTPLIKREGTWQPITWENALDLFYTKLQETVEKFGSQAVLHMAGAGSAGVIKQHLPTRFFNQLGGVTQPGGSLCWGAGIAAQKADFGIPASPPWNEIAKAKTILVWGRDPATTNVHLLQYINEARKSGAKVIVINPLTVPTVKFADIHLAVRPGTDGLLALAMAQVIIAEDLVDHRFINNSVNGYANFAALAAEYPPEKAAAIIGITAEAIREIARLYAKAQPATLILGYGLQRYEHGGATIRAIDALAAITGQLGKPGTGVHYANRLWGQLGKEISAAEQAQNAREIPWAKLATMLPELEAPVTLLVVERGNPVTQMPDAVKTQKALSSIPFKVVIDYYLTDTADMADLFLPASGNFEEEDMVVSSWNEYIYYKAPIVKQSCSEYGIWQYLAKRFKMGDEWEQDHADWLQTVLKPYGLTLTELREQGYLLNPHAQEVSFADGRFFTASGRFELLGRQEIAALFHNCKNMTDGRREQGKLVLMTPHRRHSLHSQHFHPKDSPEAAICLKLNPADAERYGLAKGDLAKVETSVGHLTIPATIDAGILPGIAVIEQGGWLKEGLGVNILTEARNTDIGDQAAFYHTFCTVRKA